MSKLPGRRSRRGVTRSELREVRPMTVRVELMGRAADETGVRQVSLELPEGATARQAAEALVARYPRLDWMLRMARPAVNLEYASWETVLPAGAEVAFIPP